MGGIIFYWNNWNDNNNNRKFINDFINLTQC